MCFVLSGKILLYSTSAGGVSPGGGPSLLPRLGPRLPSTLLPPAARALRGRHGPGAAAVHAVRQADEEQDLSRHARRHLPPQVVLGSTIGFHNHGEGPYYGLLLIESAY